MRRRVTWEHVGVPLILLLAAEAAMLLSAALVGQDPLQARTWAHWDAGYYLRIAARGYYLVPCSGGVDGPRGAMCGDAAWFPALSWLTALLTVAGGPQAAVMLGISRLAAFGTLVVAWNALLDRRRDGAALAAMVVIAFAPGAVYLHAQFPTALAALGLLGTLALVRRARWGAAALAGAATATTYTTAWLLAPALALWALLGRGRAPALRERARPAALLAAGPALGLAVVWLVMTLQTGRADAFRLAQGRYDYAVLLPIVTLRSRLSGIVDGPGLARTTGLQSLVVALLLATCVVWALAALRRHRAGVELELAAVLLAVLLWVLPYTLAQSSLQRSEALLVPLALVVARLPGRLAWAFAGSLVAVAGPMASYYVRGTLV